MRHEATSTPRKNDEAQISQNQNDLTNSGSHSEKETEVDAQPKRMTVVLPAETARMLEILSELQSISMNEAIRRAISTEAFIQHEVRNNSKVLLETKDGKIKELIFR